MTDGDTIIAVTSNQTTLRIRRLGIDDPEISHGSTLGPPLGPLDIRTPEA